MVHSNESPRPRARKSLGQNFLRDENVAQKIVRAIAPRAGEQILEIGPGYGVLTKYFLQAGCRYTGVEIDSRLAQGLQNRFGAAANFALHTGDFLALDLSQISAVPASLRIVGNIPYHITSSILFKAFAAHQLIRDMVLMVQKEVAARIVASPGTKAYGILSVITQTCARPEMLFTVSPQVFVPKPEVQSAVVRWDFQQKKQPGPDDAAFFRQYVRAVFNQRRKTLRNSLKLLKLNIDLEAIAPEILRQRPENLRVDEHISLANALYELANVPEKKGRESHANR